jgi:cell division transport system permease protein
MDAKIILKKFIQNLRSEKNAAVVNLCILAVAFLSVTTVVTLLTNLGGIIKGAREHFQMTIYLRDGAGKARTEALMAAIGKFPEIRSVKYVSKESFRSSFLAGGAAGNSELKSLGSEVFPATLQVKLSPEFTDHSSASALIGKLRQIDIVEDVGYHESWLRNLSGFLKITWAGFLAFGILILLSSLFVQSNMIQLSFSKRKRAIEVMRMCGATTSFIEGPVLLEGFLLGLAGSVISLAVTWGALLLLKRQIASYLQGIAAVNISFIPFQVAVVLVVLCAVTGMCGAYLASRKVLRV